VAAAQYQLGQCFVYGLGVTADHDAAQRWLGKADAQGLELAGNALRWIAEFSAADETM
jgi:TPR repeat protein